MGAGFPSDGFGLDICDPGMEPRLVAAADPVAEILHALRQLFSGFFDTEPDDLVTSLSIESTQHVDVLARKALMHEQQLHSKGLRRV